jgi:hypothetical protein
MTSHAFEADNEKRWTSTPRPEKDSTLDPHHVTETVPSDYRKVLGWGVDLDPKNRPMFPKELSSDVMTARGDVQDWQVPDQKIHMSIEHPNLTPVFGISCPPKGLSGVLRDYAYHYSEGTNRHWMTLTMADRIDVIESLIGSALRGHPDRYIKEKGWGAKLKYAEGHGRNWLGIGAGIVGVAALAVILSKALTSED